MRIFITLDKELKQKEVYYFNENGIRTIIPFCNLKKLDLDKIYGVDMCVDLKTHTKTCILSTSENMRDDIKNFVCYIS